jgi:hypothetical protein
MPYEIVFRALGYGLIWISVFLVIMVLLEEFCFRACDNYLMRCERSWDDFREGPKSYVFPNVVRSDLKCERR